jgi:hypothetical protein
MTSGLSDQQGSKLFRNGRKTAGIWSVACEFEEDMSLYRHKGSG